MMRQRWGLILGVSGIAAALIVACSGNDIPPISNDERDDIEDLYGEDDVVGAAGSSMTAAGAGGGGVVGRGGSGAGGAPPVAGRGGSGAVVGGGGSGSGTPCNAPMQVFAGSCAFDSGCHGPGSPLGDFAVSEAAALEYLDVPAPYAPGCGLWIDSSNPERSAILTKTQDTTDPGCGQQMPLRGDLLNAEQQACIASWLSQFGD